MAHDKETADELEEFTHQANLHGFTKDQSDFLFDYLYRLIKLLSR